MLCHIFSNAYEQTALWMLPLCFGKVSTVTITHTHTHARSERRSNEHSLRECYTWFLFSPWTAMAVGFPFSGTHVERSYVWILNRKPQRIPNWEHSVMLMEVLFLLCQDISSARISVMWEQLSNADVVLKTKSKHGLQLTCLRAEAMVFNMVVEVMRKLADQLFSLT